MKNIPHTCWQEQQQQQNLYASFRNVSWYFFFFYWVKSRKKLRHNSLFSRMFIYLWITHITYIRLLFFLSNVNHVQYYVAVLNKFTSQLVFDLLAKANFAFDACQQFILDPAQLLPLVKAYGIFFPRFIISHAETISLIAYKNNSTLSELFMQWAVHI